MAIWLCFITKYTLVIWRQPIAKCTLAIWRQLIAKLSLAILGTSYHLSRNNRGSSFYLTRGVNYIFSHVSLILVATFLFWYFHKIATY
jgi:hypothetical protein